MRTRVLAAAGALACALGLAVAAPAYAEVPSNDDIANAIALTIPTEAISLDMQETTTQTGEPVCGFWGGGTVWYTLTTATDTPIRITWDTWSTAIALYTATDPGDLTTFSQVACAPYAGYSPITQTLSGGTTYYLQAQGGWGDPIIGLTISPIVRPANDDFANALPISFGEAAPADTRDATEEPGEPQCQYGMGGPSVWYSFTAPETKTYAVTTWTSWYSAYFGVYTGTSFPLEKAGCGQPAGFAATAGTTYWIQALGMSPGSTLVVTDAPAPDPFINLWTDWPMAGSPVQFHANRTEDPVGLFPTTVVWDFGDGTITSDNWEYPTHVYAKDGDYPVTLTSTTSDGRTGKATWGIQVRTHDVSVVSFTAPKNARVGQVKTFVAGLRNTHYAETVQVSLQRGGPGGWVEVTRTTVTVSVKTGNKTTSVNLPYVFTAADAKAGQVSFKVEVSLSGPELQTTDNTMVCAPVRVTK